MRSHPSESDSPGWRESTAAVDYGSGRGLSIHARADITQTL